MKTLLKVALLFFLVVGILVGAAFFVLTRPGVQTSLIEKQLPPGSSLQSVRITLSSLSLSGLKLALPDGTVFRVAQLETDLKPLAAFFDRTVRMDAIQLEGLVVELQEPVILVEAEGGARSSQSPAASGEAPVETPTAQEPAAPVRAGGSPLDAVYSLGQLDWLFDIGSISIDGEVRDPAGSVFALQLRSDAIRPGVATSIDASLRLRSAQPLASGLQTFDAAARGQLIQNERGGFEQVSFELTARSSDVDGNPLLSLTQDLQLSVQSYAETASMRAEFQADLPRPGLFIPEFSDLPGLSATAGFQASAAGRELTLSEASFVASSAGQPVAELNLQQSFTLGSGEQLTGALMDFRLMRMPLAWLTPWLPDDLALLGDPLTLAVRFSGEADGQLLLESIGPLEVGPISVFNDGAPLLQAVTLTAAPRLRVSEDQSFSWDLGEFRLMDRYGELMSGQSTGQVASAHNSSAVLPTGVQTKTHFELGLLELSQQPFWAGRSSLLTGRAQVSLRLDSEADSPYALQGAITGLSARERPGLRRDYRFSMQLNEPRARNLVLGATLEAGAESRPSTIAQVAGQFQPGSEPMDFQVDLTSPRMSQQDLTVLTSAFSLRDPDEARDRQTPLVPDQMTRSPGPADSAAGRPASSVETPPWSGLDGPFSAEIDAFLLNSGRSVEQVKVRGRVSDALFDVGDLQAELGEGRLEGQARAGFKPGAPDPYEIGGQFRLRRLDPSLFADSRAGAFPVQGAFDGDLSFNGRGRSLEDALDQLQGELTVTGREGVLTAFELDQRSQLGLLGAGLLGQQFKRPGISALAQAVPYFENMPFEHFELKLSRGADKNIRVPKLQFKGDSLWIDGSGFIAATRLQGLLDQPLDLTLELGAKGKLVEYLEALQLLGTDTGNQGFRRWSHSIDIGGTLGNPDTSALKQLLSDAAKQAIARPSGNENEAQADPAGREGASGKSKEEKLLEDVGTGLDLLNTVLGR